MKTIILVSILRGEKWQIVSLMILYTLALFTLKTYFIWGVSGLIWYMKEIVVLLLSLFLCNNNLSHHQIEVLSTHMHASWFAYHNKTPRVLKSTPSLIRFKTCRGMMNVDKFVKFLNPKSLWIISFTLQN